MSELSDPPFVVVAIDTVDVTLKVVVGGMVVVDMVTVALATVVVGADTAAPAGAKVPDRLEPRPPETATTARARRTPAASPNPKRFPSISFHPP
ncbi:MAG TPA: hypothetical protein VED22_07810 [Nitrososphaerales archaeon]|nr:hypothetical protein [Nitrososphaerales archaeon]